MKLTYFGYILLFCFLSSCELLPNPPSEVVQDTVKSNDDTCVWKRFDEPQSAECGIAYWIKYWAMNEAMDWPKRKENIKLLSNSNSDMLRRIILSQGIDTPYQDRLRAQIWAESIMPKLNADMYKFILVAIYRPNLERLEMESALVTLSKTNSRYISRVEQLKNKTLEQAKQIEQLLRIESSIIQTEQEGN
ncbi:hypothetical protein [Paraglaciecola sp.]|uniref:hypothetical protein n=1 Tax=Paraglaciecola sp. TaxID=1920173 RepID=UPI003EF8D732